jgi:peptidoglycan-associated lipoprotein
VIRRHSLFSIFSLILGLLVLTGCPPKKKMAIEDKAQDATELEEGADAGLGEVQIGQDWAEIPSLSAINFDYDSSTLNESQRNTLKANVAILKKLPATVSFRVEGHTDDRGTIEYNIALGQRRAQAISNFYSTAGLGKSRVKTISYGEERPLCTDQTDDCWARNRRGVTTVRNDQPISVNPDTLQ